MKPQATPVLAGIATAVLVAAAMEFGRRSGLLRRPPTRGDHGLAARSWWDDRSRTPTARQSTTALPMALSWRGIRESNKETEMTDVHSGAIR
jgi:hypothetical protein